ncbi:MAG TPA: alpha/beta hydrolase [Stellaceae bacterium]
MDSGYGPYPLPDEVQRLDRYAGRRHGTPCGLASMMWREWGGGPPVVLLHGGYGSFLHWHRNIRPLTKAGYRVIAPDLPGLGESASVPPTENVDDVSDIVCDGLVQILPEGRFHLVGFSFGSQIAGRIATRLGRRVRSFTIVGAGGLGLSRGSRAALKKAEPGITTAAMADLQRDNLGKLMFYDPAKIDDVAIYIQIRNIAFARFKSVPFAPGDRLARALPLVKAPIGGIWGEFDITAHPHLDEREALLKSIQPDAKFHVVRGVGHWVQYEGADEFNRVLLDWLERT